MRALAVLFLSVTLAACQQEAPAAPQAAAAPSPTGDTPCHVMVNAIGYADLLLKPPGQEESQNFEDAVVSRLQEVRGYGEQVGPGLPGELAAALETVLSAAEGLARTDLPREQQVELLRKYRPAARQIVEGCT